LKGQTSPCDNPDGTRGPEHGADAGASVREDPTLPSIQFDLKLPHQSVTWEEYRAAAQAADELAFGTFWGWDHLYPIFGDMEGPEHECYTMLAATAAVTKRIRIGAHVSGVMYRNPALQIKMATEIDVISGGRFDFGIGAAWAEREFRAFHLPFPEPKVRIGTLRETLDLAKLAWSGDPRKKVTYQGKYVQATDLFLNPQPIQRPHPPIVIGGGGEQLTLRVVARHADVWHGFGDPATLKRKIDLIHGYARDYGRDVAEIAMSANASIWVGQLPDSAVQRMAQLSGRSPDQIRASFIQGNPATIRQGLQPFIDVGITRFILEASGPGFEDNWRRISEEVVPLFN
jgi:alkanesulfonate monooxygenase SsuD/methylene tetrahydromethanopterin reductase-like flavin-dependent oxidoreductase (luciferase family)